MRFRRVKRRARPWWLGCALSIVAGAAVAHAETVIPWDEAEKHVGEEVVVEGRSLGVRCSQLSCLLAFDPTLNRFTAVVQAESFKDLPPEKLEQLYSGKQVRIRGKVVENERKPEIVLHSPSDVTLTAGERRRDRQEKETRRAQAEAETLERLATVLDRLADVTERMAAAEDRMEAVLAQLEQRETALALAQANQAPAAAAGELRRAAAAPGLRGAAHREARHVAQRGPAPDRRPELRGAVGRRLDDVVLRIRPQHQLRRPRARHRAGRLSPALTPGEASPSPARGPGASEARSARRARALDGPPWRC